MRTINTGKTALRTALLGSIFGTAITFGQAASADTLMDIYELALNNDPTLQSAEATYLAGDTKIADKAAKQALASLPDDSGRSELESQLKSAEQQGKQIQKQLKQQAKNPDQNALEDPLGALGGTTPDASGG